MSNSQLLEKMIGSIEGVPEQADVIALRQYSLDEIQTRAKRFLTTTSEICGRSSDHGDWVVEQDRTFIRLPQGASAVIYHASGALEYKSGLEPMDALYEKVEKSESLIKQVERAAKQLNLSAWLGQNQSLQFERLWQVKAAAAEKEGKPIDAVLCRTVGAYRHFVNQIPIWGAASAAVKLAGGNQLDSVALQLREPSGEVIDRPAIIRPEEAARQISIQLEGLMGNSKGSYDDVATLEWMRFGYLSLPKRKSQRLLAPVYVSSIRIEGQVVQGYVFTVSATEKPYLSLCRSGHEAPLAPMRQPSLVSQSSLK